ncbi:DUF4144 family protein [Aliivibrio logei]|uniref:DUF4144 family protein n=1 Tax=Aliivibrio logei TaxID=688 RepID=UPI0003A2EF3E|nr:DUF4144 family protein [Aliivibrio logei]
MVVWPAIVKFDGDSELDYLSDIMEWVRESELHYLGYQENDVLIDSIGAIFMLNDPKDNAAKIIPTNKVSTLEEVTELVKAHASSLGSCCVAKIGFDSILEAIRTVKSLS